MKKSITGKVLCVLAVLFGTLHSEQLYVYYPSPIRSSVVAQLVEDKVDGVDITVFGVYRDFVMQVRADEPETILGPAETVAALSGGEYRSVLEASKNGSTDVEYVLLSIGEAVNPEELDPSATIGVVDIMDRNEMTAFVERFVGTSVRVNHVTKVEDLLPLLTFRMAQAVLVPEARVAYFKGVSNQDFKVTPLGTKGEIARVATRGAGEQSIVAANIISENLPDYILGGVEWK
ncbi:hypothetical protein [Chitinivibrio alkaliphilus]|uniref:Uncharacterized protein n=1 Tax=Chitinivibrio alkaliphilus ACht1 TaxID=1313304 RepID=U7D975_9BACT|nr:hypothetical protein [Chitinivibrio alkaliphilus]ERP31647.1 hypothetical protein CALK_1511 [Chitinivibrio alkaliphilus ACht1]